MTEQLETDAEVIAALGAFQPYRTAVWPLASKLDMRRALDAAAAHRRAQPASGLADDARKIVEALRLVLLDHDIGPDGNYETEQAAIEASRDALPLAEAMRARAEAAESQLAKRDAEVGKLRAVLKLAGDGA